MSTIDDDKCASAQYSRIGPKEICRISRIRQVGHSRSIPRNVGRKLSRLSANQICCKRRIAVETKRRGNDRQGALTRESCELSTGGVGLACEREILLGDFELFEESVLEYIH